MQVSFVIPLYNCLALTQDCLRTLQATLPASLVHEIILVDDGSTDGTRDWLQSLIRSNREATLPPPVRVLLNERNLGFAGACNRGAETAGGKLLFFLNSDLILQPGWFEPMRTAFDRFPEAGLVGNVQLAAASGAIDHAGMYFNHQGKPTHDIARPWRHRWSGYRPVPALTGACFAIRRAAWRELGGFDEGYVNGGEDVDLCLRALATGRKNLVALRSVVRHHISQSPGRKRRDEENSRRLTLRWRQTIVPLAARDWCRHYLESEWHGAHDSRDFGRAARAFFHRLGWPRHPADFAIQGVQRAVEVEVARWRTLFDGTPVPSTGPTDGFDLI